MASNELVHFFLFCAILRNRVNGGRVAFAFLCIRERDRHRFSRGRGRTSRTPWCCWCSLCSYDGTTVHVFSVCSLRDCGAPHFPTWLLVAGVADKTSRSAPTHDATPPARPHKANLQLLHANHYFL